MRLIFLALAILAGFSSSAASVVVGTTRIPYSTGWEYFSSWGRIPESNSVQMINPPMFHWLYWEHPDNFRTNCTEVRIFNLQLTTNGSFASPLWSMTLTQNFYNFLPAITNADGSTWSNQVSWRVIYSNTNGTALSTNAVSTFTMPANAIKWDRSHWANQTYLNSWSNKHPRIVVHGTNGVLPSNQQELRDFVHGPNLSSVVPNTTLLNFTNSLTEIGGVNWQVTTNIITNTSPHFAFFGGACAQLAQALYVITNASVTNAILSASPSLVSVFTNWCYSQEVYGYDRLEAYGGNYYGINAMALAYDCLYNYMNDTERQWVQRIMDNWGDFYIFEDLFFRDSVTNLDRVYGNRPLKVGRPSAFHDVESHQRHDRRALSFDLALVGDSPRANRRLEYTLNFYLARFDLYNYSGEDPRIYGGISTILDFDRSWSPFILAAMMFQDKGLTNAPIYNEMADVIQFDAVPGFRSHGNPWGQVSCYCENMFSTTGHPFQYTSFAVFAGMFGRGDIMRQYNRASDATAFGTGKAPESHDLMAMASSSVFWPVPTEADRNTNSFVDAKRGWAMGLSKKPTDWDAYTNGVSFYFQARPTGAGRNSGGHFSDGQVEIHAYGANVTWAGASYFGQAALLHNGLFVDGIGMNSANPATTFPVHAYIESATNWGDGFYVRANLTRSMNLSNYFGGGAGNFQSVPNSAALHSYMDPSNARPYISNITRSVLSPHNLYQVIRDRSQTYPTNPSQFQFHWPSFPTNTTDFDPATSSLSYVATNNYNGRSNVHVYLKKLRTSATISYTQFVNHATNPQGSNENCFYFLNPFSGENYAGTNNWRVRSVASTTFYLATNDAGVNSGNSFTNGYASLTNAAAWDALPPAGTNTFALDGFANTYFHQNISTNLNYNISGFAGTVLVSAWVDSGSVTILPELWFLDDSGNTQYMAAATSQTISGTTPATYNFTVTSPVHSNMAVHIVVRWKLVSETGTPTLSFGVGSAASLVTIVNGYVCPDNMHYPASVLWTYNSVLTNDWEDTTFVGASIGSNNLWTVVAKGNNALAVTNLFVSPPIEDFISYDTNDVAGGSGPYAGIANIIVDEGAVSVTDTNPPTAPTAFTATPGDTQITLDWGAPGNQEGYLLTRTNLTSTNVFNISSVALSYLDSGLANGTFYGYTLSASNSYGFSSSVYASATPAAGGGGSPPEIPVRKAQGRRMEAGVLR